MIPPSTTCSQTTSAALRPVCGRASTEFSIFTASAGRWTSVVVTPPVSGHTIGSGSGVGVGVVVRAVVVRALVVVVAFASGSSAAHPADASSSPPTRSTTPSRRCDIGTWVPRRSTALPGGRLGAL